MKKRVEENATRQYNVEKEIAKVDKLFQSIENDKSLPTFGGFFMKCILLDNVENVNLKKMYPHVYMKLTSLLASHNKRIEAINGKSTIK